TISLMPVVILACDFINQLTVKQNPWRPGRQGFQSPLQRDAAMQYDLSVVRRRFFALGFVACITTSVLGTALNQGYSQCRVGIATVRGKCNTFWQSNSIEVNTFT